MYTKQELDCMGVGDLLDIASSVGNIDVERPSVDSEEVREELVKFILSEQNDSDSTGFVCDNCGTAHVCSTSVCCGCGVATDCWAVEC